MKLNVKHTTDYRYSEALRYAIQTMWLTPQSGAWVRPKSCFRKMMRTATACIRTPL